MIVGITGTLGAGKGTVSRILIEKGFRHYSVRGFINDEIIKRGMEINRDNMVSVGNDLRAKHGPGFIVEKLYERAQRSAENAVIESLRNPGEIEGLRKKGKFVMIAIDADPKLRYERAQRRKSKTDNVSFEKFMEEEKREMTSNDPNKQNISKCIEMSDYKIMNNGSLRELKEKVENIIGN